MNDGIAVGILDGVEDFWRSSCLDATRIWRSADRASFEKIPRPARPGEDQSQGKPLVVLGTASAAEIVAGALQDIKPRP